MRLTYLIRDEPKTIITEEDTSSSDKNSGKTSDKGSENDDREEKDVLLRSWISGTLSEETMYLIVGCNTAKEMWETLEETYLQATKDKEFQLKQQLQTIRLGNKSTDEFLKEFKGICDGLAAIHKPVNEDSKVKNFARELGPKYKTFRTVMLGKPPYPTLNQLINALRGFDLREDDGEESQHVNHNTAFTAQQVNQNRSNNYKGRGNSYSKRGNMNYNSRGRGFRPSGQSTHQAAQGQGTENPSREKEEVVACQICGRNNHTALKCFYMWDFSYQASEDLPRALASVNLNDPNIGDNAVYVDSGASTHMTNSSGKLSNLKPYKGTDKIVVGNGSELNITHIGSGSVSGLKLNEVLVVPELKKKLLSVSKLTKDNYCTIEFDESTFDVKDKVTGKQLAKGSRRGGIYALEDNNLLALATTQTGRSSLSSRFSSSDVWHARLGHPNSKFLEVLDKNKCINITCWNKNPTVCVSCQMGKGCKLPFNLRNKTEKEPLLKIHCDLWGPAPVESSQHMKFYALFLDDHNRYTWLYPLRRKSDFFEVFVKFQKMVEK